MGRDAEPVFVSGMESPDPELRFRCALELAPLGREDVLLEHLRADRSADVRAVCLAQLREPELEVLLAATQDPSALVARTAASRLGDRTRQEAEAPLRALLEHSAYSVRLTAARELVKLGVADAAIVDALEDLLEDPECAEHDAVAASPIPQDAEFQAALAEHAWDPADGSGSEAIQGLLARARAEMAPA